MKIHLCDTVIKDFDPNDFTMTYVKTYHKEKLMSASPHVTNDQFQKFYFISTELGRPKNILIQWKEKNIKMCHFRCYTRESFVQVKSEYSQKIVCSERNIMFSLYHRNSARHITELQFQADLLPSTKTKNARKYSKHRLCQGKKRDGDKSQVKMHQNTYTNLKLFT